jgi:methylated-DNA-[protein]-cysteine S-methyltransferase
MMTRSEVKMNKMWIYDYPGFGKLGIIEENGLIAGIFFDEDNITGAFGGEKKPKHELEETALIKKAGEQLREYFAGKRKGFDLPLKLEGTDFQKAVWQALIDIPYGETLTYKDVAEKIGRPKAARAVGSGCNRNKIAVVIPCHRVVGSSGKLTGYAGGLSKKDFLLELEKNK